MIVRAILSSFLFLLPLRAFAEILTTVRVVEKPNIVVSIQRKRATLNIQAVVRNVGDVAAKAVTVKAELPSGEVLPLTGPTELERNQKEIYTLTQQGMNVDPKAVRIVGSCENCHH